MSKRHIVAVAALVALLGYTGAAAAQSPAEVQYNGPGNDSAGGVRAGTGGGGGGGNLPFTGFDAALVALGGAGIAATGVVLRRTARAKRQ